MKTGYRFLIIAVIGLLLGAMAVSTVYALPPVQDERPSDDGGSGGDGNGGGDNGDDDGPRPPGPSGPTCAALNGQVLNWGVGGLGGVGINLETGSWQVSAASASDGNYGFGGLGVGVARLEVILPPDQVDNLTPLIQDAGVYLNCNVPTIANIAVYSGDAIEPPVTLELSAPAGLTPGENTVIRALINNSLPNEITNVIFTSILPPGLTPLTVETASTSASSTRILDAGPDGQLVYLYMSSIAAGADENLLITAAAADDLPTNIQLKTTATLFYRESVAVQDSIEFRVGGAPLPAVAPATATPIATATTVTETVEAQAEATATATPVTTATVQATASPTATVEADDLSDDFVPPDQMPTTGDDVVDDFVPPPSLLPETGVDPALPQTLPNTGIGFLLPLAGLGFGGLAFALHQIRRRRF